MKDMQLTITFCCSHCDHDTEQTETVDIRRGQRVVLKCGFCNEVAVEIQANKKKKKHKTLCERCTTTEPEIRKSCSANCEEHDRERTPQ